MNEINTSVLEELNKVIIGKEDFVEQVWMAILAKGHVLIEDHPGTGKTTVALAISKILNLQHKRVQFTPDLTASDITGFTMYDKQSNQFTFKEGAAMCNLLLADEINRTSSRTQSALLEAMQEGCVTVDSVTYELPKPFHVIATQNPNGSVGTQPLPQAQLDRFMVKLSIGYPDFKSQVALLRDRQAAQPLNDVKPILTQKQLLEIQQLVEEIHIADELLHYITEITEETRNHPQIAQGVSPRGALAICSMAKARAYIMGRTFVLPEDVLTIGVNTMTHRIIFSKQLTTEQAQEVILEILKKIATPEMQVFRK